MQQQVNNQQMLDALVSNLRASGLKTKLLFTLAMIALFRFGAQLPIYGINNEAFMQMAAGNNMIGFLIYFQVAPWVKFQSLPLVLDPTLLLQLLCNCWQ